MGRWTEEKKGAIRESRVQGTTNLAAALAQSEAKPAVLVCASAIGFYGNRGDEVLREDSPAGHIAKLAGLLAPVAPGFVVSPDALGDGGLRPTKAEWSRFLSACDLVRSVDAESA